MAEVPYFLQCRKFFAFCVVLFLPFASVHPANAQQILRGTWDWVLNSFPRTGESNVRGAQFPANRAAQAAASKLYDTIIIGGGATGCPLARTLAEAGKDILLIERGGARKNHPNTLDIYGAGIVIDDADVSQVIITTDQVRSHIGAVLSGGTAINMAIVIEETWEYFDYLKRFAGVDFDEQKLQQAFDWTVSWAAHPMPSTQYGEQWAAGLSEIYGPNRGYKTRLDINSSWIGSSLFDSKNLWFRVASDVSLGVPGRDYPPTLNVLLRHNVHKIGFERNPQSGALRATCVHFLPTAPEDIAPIRAKPEKLASFKLSSWLPLKEGRPIFTAALPTEEMYTACVKPGGEIISSAGAILTPILLYKSGVGPKEAVERIGAPLIYEMPALGDNLRDRVLIPVGLFFKNDTPSTGYPPRICQAVGLSHVGSDCDGFSIGDRSLTCTAATAEEVSGAQIAEGIIYATRYVVPIPFRNEPFFDVVFQIFKDCSEGRSPYNRLLLDFLCPIVQPLVDCFRKSAANFYFTSEPKSLGKIHVLDGGAIRISGNYLTDEQDLEDAMRGVANIIRVINSHHYEGVFEEAGLNSCPLTIMNGFISLLDNYIVETTDTKTTDMGENETFRGFVEEQVNAYKAKAQEASDSLFSEDFTNSEKDQGLEGAWFKIFGETRPRKYWTSQRYATYPPTIPEATDPEQLKKFAKAFATSIWHWVGSASMGVVVDDHFRVYGFENLRIIDASVMNRVTRMNPTFTLLAWGRYAGLLINGEDTHSARPSNSTGT